MLSYSTTVHLASAPGPQEYVRTCSMQERHCFQTSIPNPADLASSTCKGTPNPPPCFLALSVPRTELCFPSSRVEALPPKVIVFGGGPLGGLCSWTLLRKMPSEAHVSCYGGRRSACLSACTALTFTGCDGNSGGKEAQPWPGCRAGVSRSPSRPCRVSHPCRGKHRVSERQKNPAWLVLRQTKVTLGSLC